MKIETKFSIGDMIFTVSCEDVTDTCPNCKGAGHFFYKDGRPATEELGGKCAMCRGTGQRKVGMRWVRGESFKVGGMRLLLHDAEAAANIEGNIIYLSAAMSGPTAHGGQAFRNSVVADRWCHEENKKPLEDGVPV